MSEISNKFLVGMLVIAIALSLVGTAVTLQRVGKMDAVAGTGWPITKEGQVDLTITQLQKLNVTDDTVSFGTVEVKLDHDSCVVNTSALGIGEGCESAEDSGPFVFENIGNEDIGVNVSSNHTASSLIGGSLGGGPVYSFSCSLESGDGTPMTDVTAFDTEEQGCFGTDFTPNSEGVTDIYIAVPRDAQHTGLRTDTITFTVVPGGN